MTTSTASPSNSRIRVEFMEDRRVCVRRKMTSAAP
jgi:hypothetical protein